MDYIERLRRLAMNDPTFAGGEVSQWKRELQKIDAKTLALVRIGAIIAVGAAVPSFGEEADVAMASGASVEEIVDVLVGLEPVLGRPCLVAAAPKLALALGYDFEANL